VPPAAVADPARTLQLLMAAAPLAANLQQHPHRSH
jgi:hypothetical protein